MLERAWAVSKPISKSFSPKKSKLQSDKYSFLFDSIRREFYDIVEESATGDSPYSVKSQNISGTGFKEVLAIMFL
jgi:hypothetical protein